MKKAKKVKCINVDRIPADAESSDMRGKLEVGQVYTVEAEVRNCYRLSEAPDINPRKARFIDVEEEQQLLDNYPLYN